MNNNCIWTDIFSENEKIALHEGFTITGSLSVMLGLWLNLTLLLSNLRFENSYNNMASFTLTALTRRFLPVVYLPFVKYLESAYGFQDECCEFLAFLETFLAVLEVECLTHVCIERYVVAKYVTNGWTVTKNHYHLFLTLCIFFAFSYSLPPLLGFGRYAYDLSCTICTFDMILPDSWEKYFIVTVYFIRSVKPAAVMITMLIWTRVLERKYYRPDKSRDVARFTRCVMTITAVNLICWTPIAAIRGWVILSQFLYHEPMLMISPIYIQWAMWIHWVAPAVTAIAIFIVDKRVRNEMLFLSMNGDCSGTNNCYSKED